MFGMTLSKGSPLPFEVKELGPDGRPIIGLFYFKFLVLHISEGDIIGS